MADDGLWDEILAADQNAVSQFPDPVPGPTSIDPFPTNDNILDPNNQQNGDAMDVEGDQAARGSKRKIGEEEGDNFEVEDDEDDDEANEDDNNEENEGIFIIS